jgi:hypothetical protein
MSRSPADLQVVLDTIARQLCHTALALLVLAALAVGAAKGDGPPSPWSPSPRPSSAGR